MLTTGVLARQQRANGQVLPAANGRSQCPGLSPKRHSAPPHRPPPHTPTHTHTDTPTPQHTHPPHTHTDTPSHTPHTPHTHTPTVHPQMYAQGAIGGAAPHARAEGKRGSSTLHASTTHFEGEWPHASHNMLLIQHSTQMLTTVRAEGKKESTLSVSMITQRQRAGEGGEFTGGRGSGAALYDYEYYLESTRGRKRILNTVTIYGSRWGCCRRVVERSGLWGPAKRWGALGGGCQPQARMARELVGTSLCSEHARAQARPWHRSGGLADLDGGRQMVRAVATGLNACTRCSWHALGAVQWGVGDACSAWPPWQKGRQETP